jgi:two-component system response regulator AtoC
MKEFTPSIFILEDEKFYGEVVKDFLDSKGYNKTMLFGDEGQFIQQLFQKPNVIILDHTIKNTVGIDIMRLIKTVSSESKVIYLHGQDDLFTAVKAFKNGAIELFNKDDSNLNQLLEVIDNISELSDNFQREISLEDMILQKSY